MTTILAFKNNPFPTIGVELELQLVDLQYFNLAMEAKDFLRRLSETAIPLEVKPEITQSMIELNSSIHRTYPSLLNELKEARDILSHEAMQTHIGICGGGAHPFQKWNEQRIFPTERFSTISEQYGYLAKQFTVFGQHIHIGCQSGDDALYLCHALARYLPHFIALSAASPFHQGVDTAFDCSRLAAISSFPLSGTPPWGFSWSEFEKYYENMLNLGIIKSIKDFYWDIRPKPEFGTIELRICDTPLTIKKAAQFAGYLQMLCCYLLDKRREISREIYMTYLINRFHAARYGLDAIFVDPIAHDHLPLSDEIVKTCNALEPYSDSLECQSVLKDILNITLNHENDAAWLRKQFDKFQSLNDVVRCQVELWRE